MITFDEACHLMAGLVRPLAPEYVPLASAAGRVLAEELIAQVDASPADCSAMDGYAVRSAGLPGSLRVVGESYPGKRFEDPLAPGTCVRIFTGAPIPSGCDRVVIQERVVRIGAKAEISAGFGQAHIRTRGSDFRAGDPLLERGQVLSPRALVAAAGADRGEIAVRRRPRVSVLATGDELAPPGEARLRAGAVPDSVSAAIGALAEGWGASISAARLLPDDPEVLQAAAGEALEQAELLVVTGGASTGDRDFAKLMFERQGLEIVFSKVAMKPGKPAWLGRCRGRLALGLPGNPTSALVTARLLLAPLVAGLSGRTGALHWFDTKLASPLPAAGDRETFTRARRTAAGAIPLENQDSGAQRALVDADLLVRSPPYVPARRVGDPVKALEF